MLLGPEFVSGKVHYCAIDSTAQSFPPYCGAISSSASLGCMPGVAFSRAPNVPALLGQCFRPQYHESEHEHEHDLGHKIHNSLPGYASDPRNAGACAMRLIIHSLRGIEAADISPDSSAEFWKA